MLFAYIDPATGAMILQIVAAAVLAGGVFLRKIIFSPFAFLFRKNTQGEGEKSEGESSEAV